MKFDPANLPARIHYHEPPDGCAVSGWLVAPTTPFLPPVGPFPCPRAAFTWATEWTNAQVCLVPTIAPETVQANYLEANQC